MGTSAKLDVLRCEKYLEKPVPDSPRGPRFAKGVAVEHLRTCLSYKNDSAANIFQACGYHVPKSIGTLLARSSALVNRCTAGAGTYVLRRCFFCEQAAHA